MRLLSRHIAPCEHHKDGVRTRPGITHAPCSGLGAPLKVSRRLIQFSNGSAKLKWPCPLNDEIPGLEYDKGLFDMC